MRLPPQQFPKVGCGSAKLQSIKSMNIHKVLFIIVSYEEIRKQIKNEDTHKASQQ